MIEKGAPMVRSASSLASLVIQAQKLGTIDGWREYIRDQQLRSGISNEQMAEEINRQKACEAEKGG